MEHDYQPELWHDLYVMLGSSSAALIGLLFVATSLHLKEIVNNPIFRLRTRINYIYLIITVVEAALASGSWNNLRVATEDRLHQPARRAMFPAMPRLFAAALGAGAQGVFLSGGGSTILALAHGKHRAIANALAREARPAGVSGRTHVVELTSHGARVSTRRPPKSAASRRLSVAASRDA